MVLLLLERKLYNRKKKLSAWRGFFCGVFDGMLGIGGKEKSYNQVGL